jgi:hypothetical protein
MAGGALFLLSAPGLAPLLAAQASSLSSPCAAGAGQVLSASPLNLSRPAQHASPSHSATPSRSPSTSPSRSPTSSPSKSPSTSPSPSRSPHPSRTPSPSRTSASPSKSGSPTPSHTSPSPTRSPSPTPTRTPSPTPKPGAICVAAQLVPHSSKVWPGGSATYSVWVWSTIAARRVTASVAGSGHALATPRYALCPLASNTTCSIGSLPPNQALELLVTDRIGAAASAGEQVTLTVTVQAAGLSPAEAAVTVAVGQVNSTPTPTPTIQPTLPAAGFPQGPSTTLLPGSLTNLFPVVTPQPAAPPTTAAVAPRRARKVTITPTASSLPLDPRLIGGQLAGLAVLAAAVTMVIARLSLRTPQAASSSAAAPSAAAGAAGPDPTGTPAS